MRRLVAASAVFATGCLLTSAFDRFDTSPPAEGEAGAPVIVPVSGTVTLSVPVAPKALRVGTSTTFVVKISREGNAQPTPIKLTLKGLPAGFAVPDLVVGATESEKTITVSLAAGGPGATHVGSTLSVSIEGTVDATNVAVRATATAIRVLGAPGEIDTKCGGEVSFNPLYVTDRSFSGQPVHVAEFIGSTLAVIERGTLHLLETNGASSTVDVAARDAPPTVPNNWTNEVDTIVADGDKLNIVMNAQTSFLVYGTTTGKRGTPKAFAPVPGVPAGQRCAIDREGLRISCRTPIPATMKYDSPLRRLDGPSRDPILALQEVDVSTILHLPQGWLLAGTNLPAVSGPNQTMMLRLVDDVGQDVPGFSFDPGTVTASGITDALVDDTGIVVSGLEELQAAVRRYDFSGAPTTGFGSGGKRFLAPQGTTGQFATFTLRLLSSPEGLLAGTYELTTDFVRTAHLARMNAKTGAPDPTFGAGGEVAITSAGPPIAIAEVGDRILFAYLTVTGARVTCMYP